MWYAEDTKKEVYEDMDKQQYICPKCGNRSYEADQLQATGGNFAKLFDIQNKKFVTVSCTACGYTELYNHGVLPPLQPAHG